MEYAVDVLDSLGGKALRAVLCGFAQGIVKRLDHVGIQRFQPHSAQGGLDIDPNIGLVQIHRAGLDAAQVGFRPGVQPLPQGLLVGGRIGAVINGGGGGFEFLGNFLLGLAGDGALYLLAGAGVRSLRVSGLPVFILLAVAGDGFLSDRTRSLCRSSGHAGKSPFLLRPGMLS